MSKTSDLSVPIQMHTCRSHNKREGTPHRQKDNTEHKHKHHNIEAHRNDTINEFAVFQTGAKADDDLDSNTSEKQQTMAPRTVHRVSLHCMQATTYLHKCQERVRHFERKHISFSAWELLGHVSHDIAEHQHGKRDTEEVEQHEKPLSGTVSSAEHTAGRKCRQTFSIN